MIEDFETVPMNYEPLSKKILLERGYCCKNGCKNCPYKTKVENSKRKKGLNTKEKSK
tara:strand:- start:683 stop:853 length:171 start_codon:yes stop_codon:yes gene_type:complete